MIDKEPYELTKPVLFNVFIERSTRRQRNTILVEKVVKILFFATAWRKFFR